MSDFYDTDDMNNEGLHEEIVHLKQVLDDIDFYTGAVAIKELMEAQGYGRATIENGTLTCTTGGWSDCEYILRVVRGTIWGICHWESSHRGGKEVYQNRVGEYTNG